jgi:hypothetical protein
MLSKILCIVHAAGWSCAHARSPGWDGGGQVGEPGGPRFLVKDHAADGAHSNPGHAGELGAASSTAKCSGSLFAVAAEAVKPDFVSYRSL